MSISLHGASLIFYFLNNSKKSFTIYLGTLIVNLVTMIILFINIFKNPLQIAKINFLLYIWLLCGFTAGTLFFIQIKILMNYLERRNDKNMYHLNYFSKRVYHGEVITKKEFLVFMISVPFFLLSGAFFMVLLMKSKSFNLTF
jgi:hypothetical protein